MRGYRCAARGLAAGLAAWLLCAGRAGAGPTEGTSAAAGAAAGAVARAGAEGLGAAKAAARRLERRAHAAEVERALRWAGTRLGRLDECPSEFLAVFALLDAGAGLRAANPTRGQAVALARARLAQLETEARGEQGDRRRLLEFEAAGARQGLEFLEERASAGLYRARRGDSLRETIAFLEDWKKRLPDE